MPLVTLFRLNIFNRPGCPDSLAGPASRQGRLVADNIAASPVKYKGVQGTAIAKIMDLTVAVTGVNEKILRRAGIEHLACYTHPDDHAAYYPGSRQMSIKLLFSPGEGKILGAQVVGYQGVDKCIDVLATALRAKMNVFDPAGIRTGLCSTVFLG